MRSIKAIAFSYSIQEVNMAEFNWITTLSGGILIGISSTLLLAFNGRIAWISGIVNGAIGPTYREPWRWLFLLGMLG
jgi:uncharacterized protein